MERLLGSLASSFSCRRIIPLGVLRRRRAPAASASYETCSSHRPCVPALAVAGYEACSRHSGALTHPLPLLLLPRRRHQRPHWRSYSTKQWNASSDGRSKKIQLLPWWSSTSGSSFQLPTWARWVIGALMAFALPLWSGQRKSFLEIEGKVDMVVDMAEAAAEAVEAAAEVAEKVSSELAEKLPEGGKLQGVAQAVEHVSKEVAAEAHVAADIIHKVEELKDEVESLVEPPPSSTKHAGGDGESQGTRQAN